MRARTQSSDMCLFESVFTQYNAMYNEDTQQIFLKKKNLRQGLT